MALSNAEHQARHRGKVKRRLALAAMVEAFQLKMRDQVTEAGGNPDCPSTMSDHVGRLMRTQEGAEMLLPFLAVAIGVPVTPKTVDGDGR